MAESSEAIVVTDPDGADPAVERGRGSHVRVLGSRRIGPEPRPDHPGQTAGPSLEGLPSKRCPPASPVRRHLARACRPPTRTGAGCRSSSAWPCCATRPAPIVGISAIMREVSERRAKKAARQTRRGRANRDGLARQGRRAQHRVTRRRCPCRAGLTSPARQRHSTRSTRTESV